jgi:hypothetical protein
MAAPLQNSNRKGKLAKAPYQVHRLTCGNCAASTCPVRNEENPNTTCVFIKKMRKIDLDSLEGIKAVRKWVAQDTITQMVIMSTVSEATGKSSKEMLTLRKLALETLASLQRDEFDEERKKGIDEKKPSIILSLREEFQKQRELPQERIELPVLEASYEIQDNGREDTTRNTE